MAVMAGADGRMWTSALRRFGRARSLPLGARGAIALVIAGAATAAQLVLWPYIPPSPMLLYYPAVVIATAACGLGGGLVAVVGATVSLSYFFLPPANSFKVSDPADLLDLTIFAAVGVSLVQLVSATHSAHAAAVRERDRARAAEAKAAHAAAVKDEVLAIVAHDLKNPLQTISLSATLLQREHGEAAKLALHATRIGRAAERASRLVTNLLDAAALDVGTFRIEPQPCELSPLIADVVAAFRPLASLRDVHVVLTPIADDVVLCDPDRIEQVLHNVIGNAMQYAPSHGEVQVSADTTTEGARIRVRDDGPGMTPEQIEHAFDRFWRGRKGPGGSGLGLFIARGIVEAHGGRITIASEPGRGTTVTIELPQPPRIPASGMGPTAPAVH